jgi:radical SAM-linked protein
VADINRFPFPDDSPLPYAEAIFDRMAVEVARGCTEGCRFCQAGMIYRPVRERDPVAVIDALMSGVKKGGYDETALTSLSTADYSCVTPLVKAAMSKLRDQKVALSVSSLRAYGLNEDLLGEMATVRAGGLTFAPEAGTQRMRDVITKNVTEEDISESAQRVFARGFQRMKLYFMIGLPTEEDVDVRGIVETASRVQAIGRQQMRGARVTASVSTHVPKPHTPFQWCAMDTEAETARKQEILSAAAKELRVDLKTHDNPQSHIEGIFARGDRRCADLLERAFRYGCRFDGWDDVLRIEHWERAIEELRAESGLEIDRYLGTIPVTARLPWDHIDIGLEPTFLAQEYRKALKDRLSPPCGKVYKKLLHPNNVAEAEALKGKKLVCYDCGVACDLDEMKEERLYYLRRMNAWAPPAPTAQAADAATETGGERPKKADRNARPQPTTQIEQGKAHRYRLRYTKLGRAAYLGHLDLVRHLPRVFRRAGLELCYSVGFHPKPELSFGPALGLGIPSLGELLDVSLVDDLSADELLARLRAVSLPGVEFLEAVCLGDNDRALGRVVASAEFAARLPDDADVSAALARWASGEPLSARRESDKGLPRTVDVRVSLLAVSAFEDAAVRHRLDWATGALVRFSVRVSQEGSARPIEVLGTLFGEDVAAAAEISRLGLWAREQGQGEGEGNTAVDPLALEPLRHLALHAPPARAAEVVAAPAS